MDLRERKRPDKIENVSAKAIIMRRYRQKLKDNSATYDEMKKKDRERKQADRKIEKEKRMNDNRKLVNDRVRWKIQKRKYRKSKKVNNQFGNENNIIMKKTVSNKSSTGNKNKRLEKERKTSATLRTQNWRLKIKLKGTHFNISSHDNVENSPGFSRTSEWRATKKAKKAMPSSPRRRSIVLNNLINSPYIRKHLEDRGVINTEKVVRQIQVS